MKNPLRNTTIRTQLTLAIFSATVIVLLAAAIFSIYWKANETAEQAQRRAHTIVAILAQDFVRSVLMDSPDTVVDMTNKLESFSLVDHAVFFNRDGTPILMYTREGEQPLEKVPNQTEPLHLNSNSIGVYLPIEYQAKHYGTAYFDFKRDSFNQEYTVYLTRLLLVSPVLLVFSIGVALFFQQFFTRPIRELAAAFDHLGQQALSTSNITSKEVAQLFHGFNAMTQRVKESQHLLAEQKEQLRITLESIADGVIATDKNGCITYLNPAAEQITGWNENSALQRPAEHVYRLVDESSERPLTGQIDETLLTGSVHISLESTALWTKQAAKIPVHSSIAPIREPAGQINGVVIIFQNVSEARELAHQLRHQATHDTLTELINRAHFEQTLNTTLQAMTRRDHHGLLYLDLDQFKIVNDTCGHTAGDALLKQIASLIKSTVRGNDIVARLGGDEFAVFLPSCSLAQAAEVAEKIRSNIGEFIFIWNTHQFRIGVSIGVVAIDTNKLSYSDLMSAADLSCYAAKDNGRNRVHLYHQEDQDLIQRHGEMRWVERIHTAIAKNQFVLFAQQVLPIDSDNPNEHIEVLVRYQDKNGNVVLPSAFLPAAERYNLSPIIDRWVIHSLLSNIRLVNFLKLRQNLRVNINLSGLTLSDAGLADFVAARVQQAKLPPKSICFEITETAAVANLAATAHFMRAMKLLGCEFALDDFGIGVSSFSYLKNLPVDYLKIDGSFVRDIDKNPINQAMVNAINQIGHVMNLKTIAEFVETQAICQHLQTIGVDFAQGYFVHQPCPLEQIFAVIEHASNHCKCQIL
ncbi:MAG: EAL domain-containing protein [Gammaproteobacteria bacterium]|nr:EAL domain-containing protein [Gammaproteobacteria bacterium]